MDSRADIPLNPFYARDPSVVVAGSANPSLASLALVSAGAPPSTGLACSLFMAPHSTLVGGGTPAPAVTRAPISKLPNAPTVKKTINKVSGKKKKAADGSTRPPKKKLACRATNAAATEVPVSLFVPPAANAHNMFDGMPTRDATVGGDQSRDAYWNRMKEHFDLYNKSGIDRTKRSLRSRWSTINKDCQNWAAALKVVDTLNPSGTNDRDRLTIAQNLFQGEEKKTKKGKIRKGRPFTLPHCYDALKDDEKWRPHESVNEESNKRKRTIYLDDDEKESSSDGGKRSPTPNSVAYSKPNRPSGGKKEGKEKKKRKGDDEPKNGMVAIVNARK
ncbi:glutathione S-transferase T3-like [Hordeum vulgare]|nr:glutathione S-transferase T3-like [Hordeum vulgare]